MAWIRHILQLLFFGRQFNFMAIISLPLYNEDSKKFFIVLKLLWKYWQYPFGHHTNLWEVSVLMAPSMYKTLKHLLLTKKEQQYYRFF